MNQFIVLLLYLDAANAATLNQPTTAIYADNVPLARFVTDTFNQHFDEWKPFDFLNTAVQQAQFFKESASGQFYRVGCHAEKTVIDLHWGAIRLSGYRLFPDIFGGGLGLTKNEHYHVSNVISVCEIGKITVNSSEVNGKPDTNVLLDGRLSSSVFLAHSETWIKAEEIT